MTCGTNQTQRRKIHQEIEILGNETIRNSKIEGIKRINKEAESIIQAKEPILKMEHKVKAIIHSNSRLNFSVTTLRSCLGFFQ